MIRTIKNVALVLVVLFFLTGCQAMTGETLQRTSMMEYYHVCEDHACIR